MSQIAPGTVGTRRPTGAPSDLLARIIRPSLWLRRRAASTADLITGAAICVLLAWAAMGAHGSALAIAAGRFSYADLGGFRPASSSFDGIGVGLLLLVVPAASAYVVRMLTRGWWIVTSILGLALAAVLATVVGGIVALQLVSGMDYPVAVAVASGLGLAVGILAIDAFSHRRDPARHDGDNRERARSLHSLRALAAAALALLVVVILIDRVAVFAISGSLVAPPFFFPQ